MIKEWDGNPGTLNVTNQNNFETIQQTVVEINERLLEINPFGKTYEIELDTQVLALMNRETYLQFLKNVDATNSLFQQFKKNFSLIDILIPKISNQLSFVKNDINQYWKVVQDNLTVIDNYIKEIEGDIQ